MLQDVSMSRYLASMLEEVMLLQTQYTNENTPPMERRGVLIRTEIAEWLRGHLGDFATAVPSVKDLAVKGNDGIGQKSEIPWVRVHSKSLSMKAQSGWYIVYLFQATGDRVYLSLGHGSTRKVESDVGALEFKPRSPEEIGALKSWASGKIGNSISTTPRLGMAMALDSTRSNLGSAYEATSLCSFNYPVDEIPDDEVLLEDLLSLLRILDPLYSGELDDPAVPGKLSDEVAEVLTSVEVAAGRQRRGRRQGRGLSAPERKVVEERAVLVATEHLKELGWKDVEDVGATESFDLSATKDGKSITVEVKGTTSAGEKVVLTRNEVKLHLKEFPNNALIVVSKIKLVKGDSPIASGGTLTVLLPWKIDESMLDALGYEYPVSTAHHAEFLQSGFPE